MNNHLLDFVKKRFQVGLEDLPEREHRVVQHFGDRRHISHDTNLEFEKKKTFGQRLADRVAAFGGSWTFISYDLPDSMLARRVRFIEAEVTHVDPHARKASPRGGDSDQTFLVRPRSSCSEGRESQPLLSGRLFV
jgi:hypothetical protein